MPEFSPEFERGFVISKLQSAATVKQKMENGCVEPLVSAARLIAEAFKSSPLKTVFFCGNGGSAADSQHLATEFVVRLSSKRDRRALPAIALTTDTSTLTASANDFGFDSVFARQIEALGEQGDILICISTSGNSKNILQAAKTAKQKGMKVIGFLGPHPGLAGPLMDITLNVPGEDPQRIQEGHITAGHILIELVEILLFDGVKD